MARIHIGDKPIRVKCANLSCSEWFETYRPNKKYCCSACAIAQSILRRKRLL